MNKFKLNIVYTIISIGLMLLVLACNSNKESATDSDAAKKVYVAPGKYDELYSFMSGGFSGQLSVYGLPSGRLFRVIPVFSQDPEKGWGYSEETKPMLNTSHGFIPWDDAHHPELSQTNGETDGRWIFINGNNVPRIARIDLKTFRTAEIIELPNSAGNHSSPFISENTEYVVAGTRFSVPIPNSDVSINEYKEKFKGTLSFVKVEKENGNMELSFHILMPGFDYDLSHAGKGKSHGWFFFTCYNSEQSNTLLEANASQNDKDFIAAVNWKRAEEYMAQKKYKEVPASYFHNVYNDKTHSATSTEIKTVKILDPAVCPGLVYYIPTPKSPHGCDIDPEGEYIVGGGKLSTVIPVFSFTKMLAAIAAKKFEKTLEGIPVLDYNAVIAGEVQNPGLGPLHTEFDGKGNAYTSMFVSSEVVKWSLKDFKVLDRMPVFYSIGHLCIPGGDTRKPYGKYLLALNKITKDRYLPTGPELTQSCQLIDISGDKMKMLLDFPTIGEPHYAQIIEADKIKDNSVRFFKMEDNQHPYKTTTPDAAKVVREGNKVHINMISIRSNFTPDNIEGIKVGEEVYFHVTNLEQDWDIPHGFAVMGGKSGELLIMPGETSTYKWIPDKPGIYPFYCTDFCSALHQEMQGDIRVSPSNAKIDLSWSK
jgi:nitrous-oxide reductase